jgi:hypothetical protein
MREMHTSLSADLLGEAFPRSLQEQAIEAAVYGSVQIEARQWTEQFDVTLRGENNSNSRAPAVPQRLLR